MTETKQAVETKYFERAKRIAVTCYQKRAQDIKILDVRGLCGYTDYLIIATASSLPQMRGIVRAVHAEMIKEKCRPLNESGIQENRWVLADYGDMVVHLFDSESRAFYALEDLWSDAPEISFDMDVVVDEQS